MQTRYKRYLGHTPILTISSNIEHGSTNLICKDKVYTERVEGGARGQGGLLYLTSDLRCSLYTRETQKQ